MSHRPPAEAIPALGRGRSDHREFTHSVSKEALTAVLTYHVVAGKVMAEDVVKLNSTTTVNGQDVDIKVWDGKVMMDDAQVTTADIDTTNGVIHVIDKVILPDM